MTDNIRSAVITLSQYAATADKETTSAFEIIVLDPYHPPEEMIMYSRSEPELHVYPAGQERSVYGPCIDPNRWLTCRSAAQVHRTFRYNLRAPAVKDCPCTVHGRISEHRKSAVNRYQRETAKSDHLPSPRCSFTKPLLRQKQLTLPPYRLTLYFRTRPSFSN